jgi:hypothetical protein
VNEYNTRWIHPPYTTFFGSANFPSPKFGPSAFSAYHCRDYYLFSSWFSCLACSNFSIKRCIAGDSLARPGLGPHRYLVANECPFRPLHSPTPFRLAYPTVVQRPTTHWLSHGLFPLILRPNTSHISLLSQRVFNLPIP